MIWRFILEKLSPELVYIKHPKNVVAAALSNLERVENSEKVPSTMDGLAKYFGLETKDLPKAAHPIKYKTIMSYQKKERDVVKLIKARPKHYSKKEFYGPDRKYSLICFKNKL